MSKYSDQVALINTLGKAELRAACKVKGISYGKLNNDGMRTALIAILEPDAAPVQTNIGPATAIEKGAATELKTRKEPKRAPAARKTRASANGVTRPSAGTICGQIWDALDAKRTELKQETPTFEHLRELAKAYGWQKNTAMTQYQRWKQFNGLMPRSFGGTNDAGTV